MWLVGKKKKFNDQPFRYHEEIELEITTLTNLGSGLGRVPRATAALPERETTAGFAAEDLEGVPGIENPKSEIQNPGGWVVMVPFTLPGERVRARVFRNHKNFSEADLIEVLTPSPDRVLPVCPLFGRCGGCQYQHLAYSAQLAWKRRQVEELLLHLAGTRFAVLPTVPSPREYGYRSKITPHFHPPRQPGEIPPIGFLRQGTRFDLLDVPACPIATPEINVRLAGVRAAVPARLAAGDYTRGATLLLRHAEEGVVTDYDAVIHEVIEVAGPVPPDTAPATLAPAIGTAGAGVPLPPAAFSPLRLHFLARDFFQNNPFILPAFTGYVRAQAAASGARHLVDAYCGSGLFALACAPAFVQVAGIEVSETAVSFARENAAANGITNATFQAGDAAHIFAGLAFPPADTVVVIDPPRKGCNASFLQQLFAFGPRAVVYVSCDAATQMRDLQGFLAAGYALRAVQPFDLFPQTRHLECVIALQRT